MIKHSQINQSNKFAISLQYLKKCDVWSSFFYMQINIKVSTSWHIVFDGNNQMISKYPQSRKLVMFLQYLQKKRLFNFFCGETKLCIQKVTGDNFFKADTILLGGMEVNKDSKYFTIKLFNKNIINKILHV